MGKSTAPISPHAPSTNSTSPIGGLGKKVIDEKAVTWYYHRHKADRNWGDDEMVDIGDLKSPG
jgi:hypothetical protein